MNIEQFFLEGLGHQSHLITDEESGSAAVVDPRRDVGVYLEAAHRAGVRITHILETHVHNDYVTGARELAARTGATIVASAGDPLHYAYRPVREGDDIQVGTLRFRVLETPGHTPTTSATPSMSRGGTNRRRSLAEAVCSPATRAAPTCSAMSGRSR